jgi:hypothetical protein
MKITKNAAQQAAEAAQVAADAATEIYNAEAKMWSDAIDLLTEKNETHENAKQRYTMACDETAAAQETEAAVFAAYQAVRKATQDARDALETASFIESFTAQDAAAAKDAAILKYTHMNAARNAAKAAQFIAAAAAAAAEAIDPEQE